MGNSRNHNYNNKTINSHSKKKQTRTQYFQQISSKVRPSVVIQMNIVAAVNAFARHLQLAVRHSAAEHALRSIAVNVGQMPINLDDAGGDHVRQRRRLVAKIKKVEYYNI